MYICSQILAIMKRGQIYQNKFLLYFVTEGIVLFCSLREKINDALYYIVNPFSYTNKIKLLYDHIFDVLHILTFPFIIKTPPRWKILAPVEGESPQ
jgi:hypothetical protein